MSTPQLRAFRPLGNNKTVNIVTTTASQTLNIPNWPLGTRALRVVNLGTDTSFIEFTATVGLVAAVTTSMPLLPNSVEIFTVTNEMNNMRVIGTAGGNTVYITYGEGM